MTLDSAEPVVGSFTADGLTYAVGPDGLALVAVDPAAASDGALDVPATVVYDGMDYPVVAIGPYAFYLSGIADVALPASVSSVDEHAFRSSDVERVEVAADNLSYASFDGCLYDSQLLRLLLIPGGRQGAVRIPDKAEGVDAAAFSHCAGVDAVSVDAGSAHYASWDGLLYDASGATLLRVPAGATDIAIRDGCTAIASGAMAGCVKLERITAPASVASISPNAFEDVPTVSLPAASLAGDPSEPEGEIPQLTAMVALSSVDGGLPKVDPSAIAVSLPDDASCAPWQSLGVSVKEERDEPTAESATPSPTPDEASASGLPLASLDAASTYAAGYKMYTWRNDTYYRRITSNGGESWTGWQIKEDVGGWSAESTEDYTSYRFYNGHLWLRGNSNKTISRWGSSDSGGKWDHCKVSAGSSSGPFTTLTDSSDYTTITNTLYIVFWNDDGQNMISVTLDKQGGTGGTVSPVLLEPPSSKMKALTKPTLSGWTFSGYTDDFSASPYLYVKGDGTPTTHAITADKTIRANWTKTVTFSANGGTQGSLKTLTALKGQALGKVCNQVGSSDPDYPIRSLFATSLKPDDGWAPTRVGYVFDGFWSTSASSGGTQWVDKDGNLKVSTCDTSTPSTLYARWIPKQITVDPNGGTVSTSDGDQSTEPMTAQWTNSWSAFGPPSGNSSRIYYFDMSQTLKWIRVTRPGYAFAGWDGIELDSEGTAISSNFGPQTTFKAVWTARNITVTWDANDNDALIRLDAPPAKPVISGTVTRTYDPSKTLIGAFGTPSIVLSPPGFVFSGWFKHQTEEGDPLTESTPFPTANATYYAHWTPVVSADVPLEVTAKVDMLGVEEQTPASGYIESRSGAALEVAQVDFEPLAGAADLFGTDVAAVYLEALAAGSTAADYRFALDATATEVDADKLAAFALPDGYGSRVPISYRFDIPEAMLPSLTETTKPVCQVVYTVALAEDG